MYHNFPCFYALRPRTGVHFNKGLGAPPVQSALATVLAVLESAGRLDTLLFSIYSI